MTSVAFALVLLASAVLGVMLIRSPESPAKEASAINLSLPAVTPEPVPEGSQNAEEVSAAAPAAGYDIVDITANSSTDEKYYFFGSVQDSYGKPWGNATVTLHVLVADKTGWEYELYSLTTVTPPDQPYPGSYGFTVPLYTNMTGAYATAEATIQEGVTVKGESSRDDSPHVRCRHMEGFIVLHAPMPDSISLMCDPYLIDAEDEVSIITAQLMLNGSPYWRTGVSVNFSTENDSIGYIRESYNNTDGLGQTIVTLRPGNTSGRVGVSASVRWGQATYLNNTCLAYVSGAAA